MRSPLGRLALLAFLLSACVANPGGRNRGARAPGSGGSGVGVGAHGGKEIAVAPSGNYFAFRQGPSLLLADLRGVSRSTPGGAPATRAVGVSPPEVVAFWTRGEGLFSLSTVKRNEKGEAILTEVSSVDRATARAEWQKVVPGGYTSLVPLSSGKGLVVAGASGVLLLDASSGEVKGGLDAAGVVVHVDEAAGGKVVVTESRRPEPRPSGVAGGEAGGEAGSEARGEAQGEARSEGQGAAPGEGPTAVVTVLEGERLGRVCSVKLETCADELAIAREGDRAFLAPTFCGRDPVSVVSLRDCSLTRVLPGFGPVALVKGGQVAVAFADRDARDPRAPPLPESVLSSPSRYHLMFIDARTLAFETMPVGERLPRFATAPGDRLLLLDTAQKPPAQIRVVDLERRTLERVWGPAVPLSAFALTPDARRAFVLSDGLYELDIGSLELRSLPLSFVPSALNLTPDGETLLVRDEEGRVHLLGLSPLRSKGLVVAPDRP